MAEHLPEDELIIDYLDGLLPAEERARFEQRLQTDARLRSRLESLRLAVNGLKQFGTTEKVKAIRKELGPELAAKRSARVVNFRSFVRYSIAAAASILVLFVAYKIFLDARLSRARLYNEAYVEYSLAPQRGGGAEQLSSIEREYQHQQYDSVVREPKTGVLSGRDSLLTGISFLKTKQPSPAIDWLKPLSQSSSLFADDAQFYLALAYLKNKDDKEAADLMKKIHNDPKQVYHDQFSDSYIRKVEELR
jgi:hypothetical protein